MSSHLAADKIARTHNCETLEERLALTTHALAELPELLQFSGLDDSIEFHSITGVSNAELQIDYVRDNFSLDGKGQTVAIIDSGIAWDHYALGGGFGEDFRVVGGWDFAENDNNPFDDGPAGFHGTHIAGIVGSDDANNEGVASGVDLVGLRVFDDRGGGKLEWVAQALQWVHEHRYDFENPITTVNLSLGVNWNSDSIPNWATLEDEFAQLKTDGIFISVAAGNSFQDYLTQGVSYPAASSSVVPVASHGSNGMLSDFSQRNDRVIAAPGENIASTIPAHIYGISGPSTKFMSTSGTSMAAPYLAGASVLLREAFELAGETGIDQQLLYEHFQETADQVYDNFTRSWYSRLNLSAAIEAALDDGHGDVQSQATNLGEISKVSSIDGIFAKSNDVDYFRFTAVESGQVSFSFDATHDLNLHLKVVGQQALRSASQVSFDVKAGQEYFVRLNSSSGQGNYQISTSFQATTKITRDLGWIRSSLFQNFTNRDESFYRFTAGRSGILTVEALVEQAASNVVFEIYDSNEQRIVNSDQANGARADFQAQKGEVFTIKIIGNHPLFDLKLTNLVRTVGSRIIAGGTGQADTYSYHSQDQHHHLDVNGTTYDFDKTEYDKVRFNGGTGWDTLDIAGSDQAETLTGGNGLVVFYGTKTDVIGRNFESIKAAGNGGNDLAVLNDSSVADFFRGTSVKSEMTGGGYYLSVEDFDRVTAISGRGGNDRAELIGSDGNDFLHIHKNGTSLGGTGFQNYVVGFEQVNVSGGQGANYVIARGTSASELFTANDSAMNYENVQGSTSFKGFSKILIKSGGGFDKAVLNGLVNDDFLKQEQNDVQGVVFGHELMLEDYENVVWTTANGNRPLIDLTAVQEVFDEYAQTIEIGGE